MELEYFPCYHSYREKTKNLSDQELGRLFRSLLDYSATGERQELAGREGIAFEFIAYDIDRAKENYRQLCEKNSENAKKGGRPRKSNGFQKNPPVFSETQKSQNKYENKNEYENEENNILSFCLSDRGDGKNGDFCENVENSVENLFDLGTEEGREAFRAYVRNVFPRSVKEG